MIKYLILSLIGYFIFTNYLFPLIEGRRQEQNNNDKQQKNNKHEDDYVDYEEVD